MTARLADFKALTFDCYGTLIDWESGILAALAPLLAASGQSPDAALAAFAEAESAQEAETPAMLYADILAQTYRRLAGLWGVTVLDEECARFGASVGDWPAFPDSKDALQALQRHYRLVILSNVDRASFFRSQQRLGVTFDAVYTAQDIGSYKPSPRNFEYLLAHIAELGIGKSEILHTAQSLFHDHAPANDFGLASAWIDRRGAREGGATKPIGTMPHLDFHFLSLAAMAAARAAEI